jgi:predicted GIY-YIG superfamily endonuclease
VATTYLICLDRPLGGPVHFAQHYIGQSKDVAARLETHRAGLGARMLAAANERGIGYQVVRTWEGGREVERRLKAHHRAWSFCPIHSSGVTA